MLKDISDSDIEVIHVKKSERFSTQGSRGMQIKWRHGNIVVKRNYLGYEDIAEVLSSYLLQYTDISDYVKYYSCVVVEDDIVIGNGCYSYDFINGAEEVTVASLLMKSGLPFSITYGDLRDFMFDIVGFDVKPYIDKLLCFDSIIRNGDRHFSNIVFLCNNGKYNPAPIFDNGDGCLSDMISYPLGCDFNKAYSSVQSKPFYADFRRNLEFNDRIRIRYNDFISGVSFDEEKSSRALRCILRGLEDMRGIAWEEV